MRGLLAGDAFMALEVCDTLDFDGSLVLLMTLLALRLRVWFKPYTARNALPLCGIATRGLQSVRHGLGFAGRPAFDPDRKPMKLPGWRPAGQ